MAHAEPLKRHRLLFAGLAVALGCLVGAALAELALRVYVAGRGWTSNCYVTQLVFFVPDPATGRTLRPGLRVQSSAYNVSVNALGMQGPELAASKPPGVTRVAVLGGSSVFGYFAPEGKDSCRRLETILRSEDRRIEVINAGVPGFNMVQSRARFESRVEPLEPDYVLLYLGWNEIGSLVDGGPWTESRYQTPPPPAWERAASASVLYGFVAYRLLPARNPQFAPPADAAVQVTEAGADRFRKNLNSLIASIRAGGAKPVISTQLTAAHKDCQQLDRFLGADPQQVAANRRLGQWINDELRACAEREALPLIDVSAAVACSSQTLGDAIHPTEEGHELVARQWAATMSKLLDAPSGD